MNKREQKAEKLLMDLQLLKRSTVLRTAGSAKIPQITPSQWDVFMFIDQHGESTVKDVAKGLYITSSAATQLVEGLVASGYMIRKIKEEDRRMVLLDLSNKTKMQVGKMKQEALRGFLKFFEVLNDREFNQYILLNEKIVERFLKNKNT